MKKILPFLLLFSACAVVVHPTGGDKDETPPKAIRTYPDSQQVNFTEREIRIYFDEYFEIKDPNAVLISPPPVKAPKVEVVGKYLRIQFKEPLQDSSTYTVQLINALQDINEKNILPDYKISFSTGQQIDTAFIQGRVSDNYTGQAVEGYTVALYYTDIANYPDSVVFPLYLSKTLSNGSFLIPAIRPTTYTLYAFNDINHNKKIDMGEDMGYVPHAVNPFDTLEIRVAKNAFDPPLVTYSPIPQDIRSFFLPFSAPQKTTINVSSSQVSLDKTQLLYSRRIHEDTLLVVDFIKADIDTQLHYYVSMNEVITDTVKVNFPHQLPRYHLDLKDKNALIPGQAIVFNSNQVMRDLREEHVHLYIRDTFSLSDFKLTSDPFTFTLEYPFAERTSYTLVLSKGAIHYFDGKFSEEDTFHFTITEKNSYGDAAILFSNEARHQVEIQLLKDLKEAPLFQVTSQSDSVFFSNLPAGEYYVRLLFNDPVSQPDRVVPFRQMPSYVYIHPQKLTI
ncbi:MAG: Ig-like domain-containing domain, partial [Bacteroidia bacterium]